MVLKHWISVKKDSDALETGNKYSEHYDCPSSWPGRGFLDVEEVSLSGGDGAGSSKSPDLVKQTQSFKKLNKPQTQETLRKLQ